MECKKKKRKKNKNEISAIEIKMNITFMCHHIRTYEIECFHWSVIISFLQDLLWLRCRFLDLLQGVHVLVQGTPEMDEVFQEGVVSPEWSKGAESPP